MNVPHTLMNDTRQDIERLIHNQKSLLDVMPSMVLIIKEHDSIEYMNASANLFFGNLLEGESSNRLYTAEETINALLLLSRKGQTQKKPGGKLEEKINGYHVQYAMAPFIGYRGDRLSWLFIHDLTEEKNHIEELSLFHKSIETILTDKINELKAKIGKLQELKTLKEQVKKKLDILAQLRKNKTGPATGLQH